MIDCRRKAPIGENGETGDPSIDEKADPLGSEQREVAMPGQDRGETAGQRTHRARERTREVVPGVKEGSLLVGNSLREHSLLRRQKHADIARRGVERTDHGDDKQRPEGR
jgi:hypothetical protein